MHVLRVDGRDGDHLPLAAVLTKYWLRVVGSVTVGGVAPSLVQSGQAPHAVSGLY
jgi:hypothetical protein